VTLQFGCCYNHVTVSSDPFATYHQRSELWQFKNLNFKTAQTLKLEILTLWWQDKNGNPPGIVQDEMVDPIPVLFKVIIRRLVRWHVIPPTCVPDSCIVNIYEEGDCIPPHIDNHDFVRPFCTVSFLSECNMLFGSHLKIVGVGDFDGPIAIPLPVGYV
jgi:alkylated DNA repair dioxygenase AlkB